MIPLTSALPWRRLTACRGLGMSPLTEGRDKKERERGRERLLGEEERMKPEEENWNRKLSKAVY